MKSSVAVAVAAVTLMLVGPRCSIRHSALPQPVVDGNPLPPFPPVLTADGNPLPPFPPKTLFVADGNPLPPFPPKSRAKDGNPLPPFPPKTLFVADGNPLPPFPPSLKPNVIA
jgi:hypothetical protein